MKKEAGRTINGGTYVYAGSSVLYLYVYLFLILFLLLSLVRDVVGLHLAEVDLFLAESALFLAVGDLWMAPAWSLIL